MTPPRIAHGERPVSYETCLLFAYSICYREVYKHLSSSLSSIFHTLMVFKKLFHQTVRGNEL